MKRPWVSVGLVPDLPGWAVLNSQSYEAFQSRWIAQDPNLLLRGLQMYRVSVGQNRLSADGAPSSADKADWISLDCYTDGGGFFAAHGGNSLPRSLPLRGGIDYELALEAELLANAVLTGLITLASHAVETGASGTALVQANVHGIAPHKPMRLTSAATGNQEFYNDRLLSLHPQPAHGALPVDSLSAGGDPVIRLAARLCNQIAQAFGVAELPHFSSDGWINGTYFGLLQQAPNGASYMQRVNDLGFQIRF